MTLKERFERINRGADQLKKGDRVGAVRLVADIVEFAHELEKPDVQIPKDIFDSMDNDGRVAVLQFFCGTMVSLIDQEYTK